MSILTGQETSLRESPLQEASSLPWVRSYPSAIEPRPSLSSAEAELYAIGSGASEGLHLRSLLTELKAARGIRFMIRTDSSAAKSVCATYGASKKLRHVPLRYMFIQQLVQAGFAQIHKIPRLQTLQTFLQNM